jgi:hypothetical protein
MSVIRRTMNWVAERGKFYVKVYASRTWKTPKYLLSTIEISYHHVRKFQTFLYKLKVNSTPRAIDGFCLQVSLCLYVRWLVAGFSPRRPGFAPRSVHVGFLMDSMAQRQVFSCQFSLVNVIPTLLHIHSYIIWWMDNGPVSDPVPQRHSRTPSQQ